ncbi:MAG TPA: ATP-binding protein, partial [Burkholderiales bacterium]|nr:ATP-binding protein [Burkholderiales bacterium]
ARLATLQRYGIVDTAAEKSFDDIVALASHICGTPISLLSLVDDSRQWFKARKGLSVSETPREVAFCSHALERGGEPLVVPNALDDRRFADNPLVTGAPNIRFYAGAPLVAPNGHALGTLCVIDTRPRQLEPSQLDALSALSRQAIAQLELRCQTRELEAHIGQLNVAHEELNRAKLVAEAATATKSQFVANMSHEIRTPLNAVIGYAQLLTSDDQTAALPAHIVEYLRTIERGGKTVSDIINNLLQLSKIEAGKIERFEEDVPLRAFFQELYELQLAEASKRGVLWRFEPGAGLNSTVRLERTKAAQIVLNLSGNALKFTPAGKSAVLAAGREGETLKIELRDEGIGIAPERQAAVFQPFEQAELSTTRTYGGTGLGLTIVRSLAELLGGSVSLESAVGHGSTFRVQLPAPLATNSKVSPVTEPVPELKFLPGTRVVLAEDDPVSQKLMNLILGKLGLEVHIAADGRRAVELVKEVKPDLVLMDMHMPEMDGLEAIRILREDPAAPHPPMVILSANVFSDQQSGDLARQGVAEFLTKPVNRVQLQAVLARLLPRA